MNQSGIPTTIAAYTIKGLLGQGGMGAVYRGQHRNGGPEVAIKIMRSHGGLRAEEERFLAEAKVLQRISHRNVIRCLDVGECELGLYMVLELIAGGDVSALMKQHGGQLPELLALRITQDVARGLEALEDANLVHRDIKPDNIFIDSDGNAKLADFGVVRIQDASVALTQAGMPVGTVAYMAPEQAQAQGSIDQRADIYALGTTLYAMLAGTPPFLGENPMMTMLMVVNEPFPDLRKRRRDCSSATMHLLTRATMKERESRYQHAVEFREAIAGVIEQISIDQERPESNAMLKPGRSITPSRGQSNPDNDTPPPRGEASLSTQSGQVMLDRLDQVGLQRVMQRVRIHENGLSAWINLAPEASFPSVLLRAVLARRGVVYGLREGAVLDASRSGPSPRRVVVACGDPPTPGCAGRDIFGSHLPPLRDPIIITINDDCTEAWALTPPRHKPSREQVQKAIINAGVRYGIIKDAITALCEGPTSADGRRLVACALPMHAGQAACFELNTGDAMSPEELDNLAPVRHGDIIAVWRDTVVGRSGMDVCGNPIPVPEQRQSTPEDLAGEGTDLGRDRQGQLILRAARSGNVQRRLGGIIRVVRLVEINGDLGIGDGELTSDDVVVIRGTVRSGAHISCSNDVVIEGDLEDACVDAGGSIEVHGDVKNGGAPVVGVDAILVQGSVQRRVVAGNLRVEGRVEHCELVATGDITLRHVIGGSVTAGGSVRVAYAGDEYATTTELWAGRNLPASDQERMARLAERRLAAERWRMVEECNRLRSELADAERRGMRLQGAIRPETLQRHQHLMERMEQRWGEAETIRENSRGRLAKQRELLRELGGISNNQDCEVSVSVLAKTGVVARVADADPLRLREDRHRLRLRLDS